MKQPAKVNYFFGQCYRDAGKVISAVFKIMLSIVIVCFKTVIATFGFVGESVADYKEHIKNVWEDEGWSNPIGVIKLGFWISLLINTAILSSVIGIACFVVQLAIVVAIMVVACVLLAVAIIIMTLIMAVIYVWFMFLWFIDWIMLKFHKIVSSCPNCQRKFALPYYRCPNCGVEHTKLIPSKYGILKRTCECGTKLPTTFFNGRQKLDAICPFCKTDIKGGGYHINISIPVVGGPSSGKTCYINMALAELEKIADKELSFVYEHVDDGTDPLQQNLSAMSQGQLPIKTSDMRLVYYNFNFTPKKRKIKNQISLCDVGGEVYSESAELKDQIGYGNANCFLMVIDPLSIAKFKKEVEAVESVDEYQASSKPIDEIIDILIKTIDNMRGESSKSRTDQKLAIVFTKCDIPLINSKIGDEPVKAMLADKRTKSAEFEVRNKLCEQFLIEYDEGSFVNMVRSKFDNVQYFTCSALGHNVNGDAFNSVGVADPILWLVDKQGPGISFKERWEKELP